MNLRGGFPFPTHPRPTAHQIFHLPPNSSRQEIKARYYDLSRFQAITAAYDVLLRGSSPSGSPPWRSPSGAAHQPHKYTSFRERHTYSYPHTASWASGPDERWKDWLIVIAGLLSLAASLSSGLFILPSALDARHRMASANLAKARRDAREYGEERRKDVKRRVAARRARDTG